MATRQPWSGWSRRFADLVVPASMAFAFWGPGGIITDVLVMTAALAISFISLGWR